MGSVGVFSDLSDSLEFLVVVRLRELQSRIRLLPLIDLHPCSSISEICETRSWQISVFCPQRSASVYQEQAEHINIKIFGEFGENGIWSRTALSEAGFR